MASPGLRNEARPGLTGPWQVAGPVAHPSLPDGGIDQYVPGQLVDLARPEDGRPDLPARGAQEGRSSCSSSERCSSGPPWRLGVLTTQTQGDHRMNIHANATTCPNSRELLASRVIEQGWSYARAAEAAGVSKRTVAKWVARRRRGESMADRSSAPRRVPSRTPAQKVEAIERLRRLRMTAAEIAEILGIALSTVSLWLRRIGLGKRSRLEPPEPPDRYERSRPGELIHVDVKRLGRFRAPASGSSPPATAARAPAGSAATWRSTTPPGSPTSRFSQTSGARLRLASFAARSPGSPSTRLGRAGDDRQRLALHLDDPRRRLPRTRPAAPSHSSLPARDQRQGRALYPDDVA